jgi:predicted DNA-binding antitoxin AbrB/MazE fold protein
MTQTIEAFFDGKVFRPETPVNLEPNCKVHLVVSTFGEEKKPNGKSLLRAVAMMNLEGPPDWSEHFEDYLNGARKSE